MKLQDVLKVKNFKSPYLKANLNILFTGIELEAHTQRILRPHNITTSQINVLRILKRQKKPISAQGIQEMMLYKKSNVTRIIDKLEDKGYVECKVKEDNKRMMDITITKKGLKHLEKVDPIFEINSTLLEEKLTEEEANILSDLLDKINS